MHIIPRFLITFRFLSVFQSKTLKHEQKKSWIESRICIGTKFQHSCFYLMVRRANSADYLSSFDGVDENLIEVTFNRMVVYG